MLTLGGLLTGLIFVPYFIFNQQAVVELLQIVAVLMAAGLAIEGIGHYFHAKHLNVKGREGAVSYYEQVTTFGKTYNLRNVLLMVNLLAVIALAFIDASSMLVLLAWSTLALSVISVAVVSRAMFYVMVVPTTMPGAFFWKNKGFEEHARESGLAKMPQVGVIADVH